MCMHVITCLGSNHFKEEHTEILHDIIRKLRMAAGRRGAGGG